MRLHVYIYITIIYNALTQFAAYVKPLTINRSIAIYIYIIYIIRGRSRTLALACEGVSFLPVFRTDHIEWNSNHMGCPNRSCMEGRHFCKDHRTSGLMWAFGCFSYRTSGGNICTRFGTKFFPATYRVIYCRLKWDRRFNQFPSPFNRRQTIEIQGSYIWVL